MLILIAIMLVLIIALLFRLVFGPRFLPAASNEWLVLVSHPLDNSGMKSWDENGTIRVSFVPIIGWKYDYYGFKYGKPTPLTPPAYQVDWLLNKDKTYDTWAYWLREDVEFDISSEWPNSSGLWEHLSGYAKVRRLNLLGSVPRCCKNSYDSIFQ